MALKINKKLQPQESIGLFVKEESAVPRPALPVTNANLKSLSQF